MWLRFLAFPLTLLAALAATSLLGAAVTWWFRIETRGLNLERL